MLTQYKLKMPGEVFSGVHAMEHISAILGADIKKVAIFTDAGIAAAGLLTYPLSYIEASGVEMVLLEDLPAEPTCDQAQMIINQFKKTGADFIVAIGGGSVMDIAKLASVLATDAYEVRDLLDHPEYAKKQVRTLMIPTTAGTGSEATQNSIVAVPEQHVKVGIVNEAMIADYVILDAEMIKNLPRKIAAATGVDALAHAIECFTSKKANPFSDLFALEALTLILNHIERACDDPEALEDKNAMMLASFYAGVAITASGTTAVHALSYPLGGQYHIPHGVSNAMMLLPVMRFNEPMCRTQFATVYDCVARSYTPLQEESEKSGWVLERLAEIVRHLDIPISLREYGIGSEDLEELVRSGLSVRRLLDNNLREVTEADARSLYQEIM
ncbi:MAG: iron-containing alcohol dehydrogenase [Hungatella sp.]